MTEYITIILVVIVLLLLLVNIWLTWTIYNMYKTDQNNFQVVSSEIREIGISLLGECEIKEIEHNPKNFETSSTSDSGENCGNMNSSKKYHQRPHNKNRRVY